MRRGFIASVLLHGAILALMFFGVPFMDTERPEPTIIPVEIIPEAQLADITTPTPKPEPEPEPEKPVEEAPPPEPEPEPAPAPAPPPPPPAETADAVPPLEEIKPEPKPKPEVKPQPKPEPRITQSITPRTKPKPPSRFDTSRVAALLDKKDQPEPQAQTETKFDPDKLAKDLNPTAPASQQQLATLKAMIQSQIFKCWNIQSGIKNAQDQLVRVRILLRSDGSLIGAPEVLNTDRYNDPDGAQFDVAARAAVAAVYRCTPLKLPRDRYDDWREVIQNFDPSQMLDVN